MSSTETSTYEGFTAEERAAMKEHAQERKTAVRRGSRRDKEAEAARDVLTKIAAMGDSDRIMAERVHAVITANAPVLAPKLWYGMPAYTLNGKVVCFFHPSSAVGGQTRARILRIDLGNGREVAPAACAYASAERFPCSGPIRWVRDRSSLVALRRRSP